MIAHKVSAHGFSAIGRSVAANGYKILLRYDNFFNPVILFIFINTDQSHNIQGWQKKMGR